MDPVAEIERIKGERIDAEGTRALAAAAVEEETARLHRMEGALHVLKQWAAEKQDGDIDDHTGADSEPVGDAHPGADSCES